MQLKFPQDKLIYLKDIKGLKVTKEDEVFWIDFEPTEENIVELFFAGAQYGIAKLNNYLFHQKLDK